MSYNNAFYIYGNAHLLVLLFTSYQDLQPLLKPPIRNDWKWLGIML